MDRNDGLSTSNGVAYSCYESGDSCCASNVSDISLNLPSTVVGSSASNSTPAIYPRATSHVILPLSTVDSENMGYNHLDPLGMGAPHGGKEVDDMDSTIGKGLDVINDPALSLEEELVDEYVTEDEAEQVDMVVPQDFFTPDRKHKLVTYEASMNETNTTSLSDSLRVAIKEVAREGWISSRTSVNEQQLPSSFSGNPNATANSISLPPVLSSCSQLIVTHVSDSLVDSNCHTCYGTNHMSDEIVECHIEGVLVKGANEGEVMNASNGG